MSKILKFKSPHKDINELTKRFNKVRSDSDEVCEMAAKSILKALDARDHYTYLHSVRVCHYSLLLGLEWGLADRDLFQLQLAALFHDIGKMVLPDAVLNKPTRLNDADVKIMKKHPIKSHEILCELTPFKQVADQVLHHHERFDGKGYPQCLKGEDIPLHSRIIFICDTFDSMTSQRVYRKPFPHEVALNELVEFSGTQFDPKLVEKFVVIMRQAGSIENYLIPLLADTQSTNKKAA